MFDFSRILYHDRIGMAGDTKLYQRQLHNICNLWSLEFVIRN